MRDRALNRKNSAKKAIRKQKLAQEIYNGGYVAPLHYLSKGKIHCSCPLCSAKTNGRVIAFGTCGRHGNNWAISDIKKLSCMHDKMMEYLEEAI